MMLDYILVPCVGCGAQPKSELIGASQIAQACLLFASRIAVNDIFSI